VKKVIIVGGGAAGLGAAYKVRRAAAEGLDVDCVLVDKGERPGGKLMSDIVHDAEGNEFVVDGGSDAFVSGKPAIGRIARLLGIDDQMVPAREENKKTLIVKGKRLIEMPDGIMMFAPTKLVPLATTRLYSWPAKFRMALDLVIPRKVKWAEGETAQDHDETLESFVVRRMGRESLDRLAEPLVGGVHASDPREMSLAATFPNFLEMEQQFGSLIRGFLNERKKREEMRRKYPPTPGAKPWAFFNTFLRGMQQLTDGMADAIGRERIRSGVEATSLERSGDVWRLGLSTGEVLEGDAVIVATEGWAAEPLVRGVDTAVADLLATIPYSSSATVPMAFRAADCPADLKWFGILSPMVEKRPLLAVTLSSSKWPDRSPADRVLLRGFIGGPNNQHLLEASDAELIETIRTQIVDLLGMAPDAQPVYADVYRWNGGMPQYTLGHLDRVDRIEALSAEIPGFALAGGAFRGVGVPNCIESGEAAVTKVLGELGFAPLVEDTAAPAPRAH
jgi:protoporphyrinogen/coproporphyrinogen III oxidase